MSKRKTSNIIRPNRKLWLLLAFLLLILSSMVFFSVKSFETLNHSIEQLSAPKEQILLPYEVLNNILLAENSIQAYILSGNDQHHKTYKKQIISTKRNIKRLKSNVKKDTAQLNSVLTIDSLFEKKLAALNTFLKLKKQQKESILTGQALTNIQYNLDDSLLTEKRLLEKESLTGKIIPIAHERFTITYDEYKGINGFFRKIFGGKHVNIDTVKTIEEKLFLTKQITIDTSIIQNYAADSTLLKVKSILRQYIHKEKHLQHQLTVKELALLKQDDLFIAKIKSLINDLVIKQKINATFKNQQAKITASVATNALLSIGAIAMVISGVFLLLIIKDFIKVKFYQKRLEIEKNKAEDLAKAKEVLLSNVSHEIRTPLQTIKGYSDLLGKSKLDEKQIQYNQAIIDSNDFLTALIQDLLDQAKFSTGKFTMEAKPVQVLKLTNEIENYFTSKIESKGVKFIVNKNFETKDLMVYVDETRLKQIVVNLLDNSFKFTHKGTIVLAVSSRKIAEKVHFKIEVRDTGIGIPNHLKKEIFKRFSQADNDGYQGLGLGLSIVKEIVDLMHGEILLESEEGKGSKFTVNLTLPISTQNQKYIIEPEKFNYEWYDTHVIAIEDDHWNAILIEETLKKQVKKVSVFKKAEDALALVQQQEISLILTDINLPGMDGYQFLSHLKLLKKNIPVIALTAHLNPDKLSELKKLGFSSAYLKPYNATLISSILSSYLSNNYPTKYSNAANEKLSKLNFEIILQFASYDEDRFHVLLKEMILHNQHQIKLFKEFLDKLNHQKLATLAHQLKTSYEQIKLIEISEALATIELYYDLHKPVQMMKLASELYPELLDTLSLLKNRINSQFHISIV